MTKIINWTAKRAGGRITVYGVDASTSKPLKVVGITEIEAGSPPVATGQDGKRYELA